MSGVNSPSECRMTRAELQKRLQESAFGRNEVMFDAYFMWDSPQKKQPRCAVCHRGIGLHEDPPPPSAAIPTPQPPPPPPPPAAPAPPPFASNPRPIATYNDVVNGTLYGQQPQYASPMVMYPPPVYVNVYQPPQMYVPTGSPVLGTGAIPSRLYIGPDGVDRVIESYPSGSMIAAGVFLFFCVASVVTGVGLLGAADSDSGTSSTARKDKSIDPYSFVSSAIWFCISVYYAYKCKRFVCTIRRGVEVVTEEKRLISHFCYTTTYRALWSQVSADGVVLLPDNDGQICCFFGTQGCVIAMQSGAGGAVPLARSVGGIADLEARLWAGYFSDVALRRSSSPR